MPSENNNGKTIKYDSIFGCSGSLFQVPIDVWVLFVLSFIIIFSAILLFARMITKLIHFLFLSKSTKLANRVMGTTFGLAKGLLIVMIFFWMIELLPNRDNADIIIKESNLAQKLIHLRKTKN